VVEGEGGKERKGEALGEAILQLDGEKGIHAHVKEALLGIGPVGGFEAEHTGDFALEIVDEEGAAYGGAFVFQFLNDGGRFQFGRRCWFERGGVNIFQERPPGPYFIEFLEPVPIDVGDGGLGMGGAEEASEGVESPCWGEGGDAHAMEPGLGVGRGHTAAGPGAPVDGQGGQAESAAIVSQDIEEVVGGGIVSLTFGAPGGGDGREGDEEIELQVTRELVKDPGAGDLGLKDGLERGGSHLLEGLESGEAGGMDNAAQGGERGFDPGQESGHGGLIGDIDLGRQDLGFDAAEGFPGLA
jgi:hypothetical protein